MKIGLSREELIRTIAYDEHTGEMRWLSPTGNRVKPGDLVRGKTVRGYLRVQINGRRYKVHDLAWIYMTGREPENIVDHINGDTSDNSWKNLREATQALNCRNRKTPKNNSSGVKGVFFRKRDRKWHAVIGLNNRKIFVGAYSDFQSAVSAITAARSLYHGEFARFG